MGLKQEAIKKMKDYIKDKIESKKAKMEKFGIVFDTDLREIGTDLHLSIAVPSEEWKEEIEKSGWKTKTGWPTKSETMEIKSTVCFDKIVKKEGVTYICMDFAKDKAKLVRSAAGKVDYEVVGSYRPFDKDLIGKKLQKIDIERKDKKSDELMDLIESDEDVSKAFKIFVYYIFISKVIEDLKDSELYSSVQEKINKKKTAIQSEKSIEHYQGLVKF